MKKKILSVIVALSMLSALVLVPLPSSAATSGDYTYTVNDDGTATITKYIGNDAEVTIPEKIDGYTVTTIGDHSFSFNKVIQKVTFPDSVEKIVGAAFAECHSLKSVSLSKNLKVIGRSAFINNKSLEHLKIPNSVTTIEEGAFWGAKLTYMNLPSSLTEISNVAFNFCTDLAYVRVPHTVTQIVETSFLHCDKDLLVIVGCANSAAQTFAEENGFTFATIPCKDHTFSSGACTCCNILLGDLNKDGVVNMDDYTIIIGYVNDPSTCPDLSIADVNQDGVLDINDRLFLLEIISGASTWPE